MEVKWVFKIPDDDQTIINLIESVPLSWGFLDGLLLAPENLVTAGLVLPSTGFKIDRQSNVKIVGRYDIKDQKCTEPDIQGIVVDQKLPGVIEFDEAGYYGKKRPELLREIACSYVRRFYRGTLLFYESCRNDNKFDNSARCYLYFGFVDKKEYKVIVTINDRFGGRYEHAEPILSVCRELKLKELIPAME